MKLRITDRARQPGSYRRGQLQGDILFNQYSYGEVSGVLSPFLVMVRDDWAQEAEKMGMICREQAQTYGEKLNQLLARFVTDLETPYEDIDRAVCDLRRAEFGPEAVDAVFLKRAQKTEAAPAALDIDQEAAAKRAMASCRRALFLLHDPSLAGWMKKDIAEAVQRGLTVDLICGSPENSVLPGAAVTEALTGLRPSVFMGPEGFSDPEGGADLAEAIEKGEACLYWYGDTGLTGCRNLAIPAMVKCVPRSLVGKALAGQFVTPKPCAVYVPPHFNILPLVPLVRPTVASYRQLARLADRAGESVYTLEATEMYRRWPDVFFSVYEEKRPGLPEGMAWPADAEASDDGQGDFYALRQKALDDFLDGVPGLKRLNGWFALDTLEPEPIPWNAEGEARGILVHGIRTERIRDAEVIMGEGDTVSLRKMMEEEPSASDIRFFSNFLFFMTSRLTALYNRLRQDRPREHMHARGGHMDYMLYHRDGRRIETFPLYRKGCMGMTEDGQFVFFHFRLGGGQCRINGRPVSWTASDVDPKAPGKMAVYTPYLSCPDAGASKFEYTKAVGQGRVNFVIQQTELICAREGDVLLPGTGAVLSLDREEGKRFAASCGLEQGEDGYYTWQTPPVIDVCLEPPADVEESVWNNMKWAYGGGLTLAQNGECVFQKDGNAAEKLAAEGWASPLSKQTQESEIAALARHPRTAIGLTKGGSLFLLVFSGRSSISAGADYVEMCGIAKKLVPDLQDMINVDGGASSVLGIGVGRRFIEYSRPSSSFDSLPGMVRPIHSAFRIVLERG